MPGFLDTTATVSRGSLYSKAYESDGTLFVPATLMALVSSNSNAWAIKRIGAANYAAQLTASGTGTFYWAIDFEWVLQKFGTDPIFNAINTNFPSGTTNFPSPIKLGTEALATDSDGHLIRGLQITSMDVVYQIATAAVTSHTITCDQNVWANNVAVAQTTIGGSITGSLATATQTNPYVTNLAFGTPFIAGANAVDTQEWFEDAIVPVTACVFTLYGVFLYYNYCLL